MVNQMGMLRVCIALLLLTLVSNAYPHPQQSDCYPNPSTALKEEVRIAAESVIQNGADAVDSRVSRLIALTVADALGGEIAANARKLEAYRYLGETERTDKQIGASAKSEGSTSAAEKPGIINLLGLAIERGAIQQEVSDTALTLSTSPYLFLAAVKGDKPKTYQDYEALNRFGFSATFNLNNKEDVLSNARRNQLTELTGKFRISGDRSTRSSGFQKFWEDKIAPAIQLRLDVTEDFTNVVTRDPNILPLFDPRKSSSLTASLKVEMTKFLSNSSFTTAEDKKAATEALKEIILCNLRNTVYNPIANGSFRFSQATLDKINSSILNLAEAQAQLAKARLDLEKFLKEFMKSGTLSTFAYTYHRQDMASNYSEAKLLFERHVPGLDVVFNGGVSFYDHPDSMKNQEKIRDFSLALSLEGSSKSPFNSLSDELGRITYSFTGRFERLKENENMMGREPDIGSIQFKAEIPIAYGLKIPIAYTYTTATEMSKKSDSKFNIGLHFDVDKLISIARARSVQ